MSEPLSRARAEIVMDQFAMKKTPELALPYILGIVNFFERGQKLPDIIEDARKNYSGQDVLAKIEAAYEWIGANAEMLQMAEEPSET